MCFYLFVGSSRPGISGQNQYVYFGTAMVKSIPSVTQQTLTFGRLTQLVGNNVSKTFEIAEVNKVER